VSIAPSDVNDMLLREFERASFANRDAEMQRLAHRAVDKVLAEFQLRGFAGFVVRVIDGELHVDGITATQLHEIPAHLQVKP
jgi:hypothetical protein